MIRNGGKSCNRDGTRATLSMKSLFRTTSSFQVCGNNCYSLYLFTYICIGREEQVPLLCSFLRIKIKTGFIRRLLKNYYFVLLTNRAPPQISENRPEMRHRALSVTSRAAWRWNKMLIARKNVDRPLAAMIVVTEHNAL